MQSPLELKLNMPSATICQGVVEMEQETAEKLVKLLDDLVKRADEDEGRLQRIEERVGKIEQLIEKLHGQNGASE